MFLQHKKVVPARLIGALFLLLLASGCAGNGSSNGNTKPSSISQQGSTPVATITPQLVTPKSSGGSQGKGPLLIFSPTPVPGGQAGSEEVVLGDRTLIINSASKQNGASANSTLIYLNLVVQNTSGKVIMNQPGFFQLIGPEGDIFDYQYNSSDNFYGGVPAHTTRGGTIVFQVPAAATSRLSLLYRPEIATEAVIIVLIVR